MPCLVEAGRGWAVLGGAMRPRGGGHAGGTAAGSRWCRGAPASQKQTSFEAALSVEHRWCALTCWLYGLKLSMEQRAPSELLGAFMAWPRRFSQSASGRTRTLLPLLISPPLRSDCAPMRLDLAHVPISSFDVHRSLLPGFCGGARAFAAESLVVEPPRIGRAYRVQCQHPYCGASAMRTGCRL